MKCISAMQHLSIIIISALSPRPIRD